MLLQFTSNAPQKPSLVVVNGVVANTGYALIADGLDFGNAAFDVAYSGPRGTQGSLPAIGVAQNRAASFPIRVFGTAKDSMLVKLSQLVEMADDMRRFGGSILWQSASQTCRQYFNVLTCGWSGTDWNQRTETNYVVQNTLNVVASPYLLGDPMDTKDTFDIDSSGDYTHDGGTPTVSVAGGRLVPSGTGLTRYRHTVKGYVYSDAQVTMKFTTGATITNGIWGVTLCQDTTGLDTGIAAEILAGTNVLRIALYAAGTASMTVTTAFTPAASTSYWVRIRREGNRVIAEVFTSAPTPTATPAATVPTTLTTALISKYASGHAGFRIVVAGTDERYDDFTVEPYTYRLVNAPEQIRLQGQIPGDVPATADLTVTPVGGSQTPIWGMAGWLERPAIPNLCWNGDFETLSSDGWTNGAVSGVIGASTSIATDTTAARVKFGATDLLITCPATTDTGASFLIVRRFKLGRTYAALCWASAASATTASRIKLGVNGDLATGTAANLSTTPRLYSVVWTPGAEESEAYVAFGINAATGTAMNIDGVVVVEVPTVTLSAAISTTTGPTAFTVYATPSEVPNLNPDGSLSAPFMVMIDQEIIRVTSISGVTWTGDRAIESTTGATHAQDAPVVILPPLRPHFEGKGALPAFGIIEADGDVNGVSSAGAGSFARQTSDSNARGSNVMRWTPGTSGAQLATLIYMVDPNTLVPDDYTLGEIDVEVWVRELWASSLTNMRVMISAQPEGGSTFGAERFSREFGNVGKLIQPAGAKVARIHRLGSLPMIVDRSNPQRWRLKLTLACTGGSTPTWDIDYLMLCPTRGRLASPTGEINDTSSASATFPAFIPYNGSWTTTSAMSKTLRSDGSALIASPGQNAYPDAGLGDVIEIPDGDCDLIVKLSGLVPDDPTLDSTAETVATLTTCAHLAVTPRYAYGRGV